MIQLALWLLTASAAGVLGQANDFQQPLTAKPSSIPSLGFGTWNLDRSNVSAAVSAALQAGFRHIDCATVYGNQKEVGKGIADGLKKTGLKRSDIWVTSKLWNDHHSPDQVEPALAETLSDLGLEYLDLWLMHWPVSVSSGKPKIDYIDASLPTLPLQTRHSCNLQAWHAMEKLSETDNIRTIGVSNFSPSQLENLIKHSSTKPAVHQFEIHPYLPQTEWVQWHKDRGIEVTAYSPFANTNPTYKPKSSDPPALLSNTDMLIIAGERGCTPAQVALVWGIRRGTSVIPKSSQEKHIKENFAALECVLLDGDLELIDDLSKKYLKRFNNPSKNYGLPLYDGLEDA